jgi:hypothetical protein
LTNFKSPRKPCQNYSADLWVKASLFIDSFYDQFFGSEKLLWAKTLEKKILRKERVKGGIGGLIISLIISLIAGYIVKFW